MKIGGVDLRFKSVVCLVLYYGFARFLPISGFPVFGKPSKWLRYQLCRRIFKKCGKNVNIERKAFFASGRNLEIGDNSGLGINCHVPSDTILGRDVMMGPNCHILQSNHRFDRVDIPMNVQSGDMALQTRIGNDVWIGRDVMFTPGRTVADGSVIGARCLLTKDFPAYSVVGGNPSKIIKSRV